MIIIYHQNNIGAFAGNHTYYWIGQPFLNSRISALVSAPTGKRLLLINPPGLDGGFGGGISL